MEEDSTTNAPDANAGASEEDDFDLSAEDNKGTTSKQSDAEADSGDDDAGKGDDDNAPSNSDEESGDEESTDDENSDEETPAFDKDLDQWAEKAGLGTLETDKERKLAQIARDNQRDFSRRQASKAAADKLAKAAEDTTKKAIQDDEDEDPMVKRVNSVETRLEISENKRATSDFFLAQAETGTPVSNEEAELMGKMLEEAAETDGKQGVDFLLRNIPRWYRLAKAELSEQSDSSKEEEAAEKARSEERKRLEKLSNSKSPSKSAKSTTPPKKEDAVAAIWKDDSI